ncbi:MAG: hypothetical protein ACFBSF_20215 [Leptolyngbyaceae cyanobacterium]
MGGDHRGDDLLQAVPLEGCTDHGEVIGFFRRSEDAAPELSVEAVALRGISDIARQLEESCGVTRLKGLPMPIFGIQLAGVPAASGTWDGL